MRTAKEAFEAIIAQLDIADANAAEENTSKVPSMWQINNSHIRDAAVEGLAALNRRARIQIG